MFRFLGRTINLHYRNGYSYSTVTPKNTTSMVVVVSLSLIRYFSISNDAHNQHSFTLTYLTKTCGLSPKSALSASKTVHFESSEKPDSVLSFFEKFGFSKTQISEMIRKYPKMLYYDSEKTISPKVEFFLSRGVSTPEIVRIFTVNPWILGNSLENQLVRTFNILIEVFQSEDKAIEVIKKNPYVLCTSGTRLVPNINGLRENGVPASNIMWLICDHWLCIDTNPVGFRKIVEEVKEMGFNPLKLHFVDTINVFTSVSKSKWDGRVEVYNRWGWSDKDITTAFKKYPRCMTISEDKIMAVMDFYVNKLGLEPSVLANCPLLLAYSLKKRLIPRGAVIQYLSSKGLVKVDSSITRMFICPEKRFLEKYAEAPHLKKLYKEKLELSDTSQSANVEG